MVKRYARRLIYRTDTHKHNFLMHPFLLMTAAYAVGLTFFQHTAPVQQSILYTLTSSSSLIPDSSLSVWGTVALLVTVLNFIGIILRKKALGTGVAMAGFMLWLYSFIVYAMFGFWLQVFFVSIPNMMFWGWYYFSIYRFHDYEDDLLH